MKKIILLIILIIPYLLFSQIQLGSTISGDSPYESFGRALSINNDGTRVAIGGSHNDIGGENAGHVRVFEYTNGAWSQLGNDILGEYPGDTSGTSVSISNDGTIVAIGAKGNEDNGNNAGHVRVYKYENNSWNQLGGDIDGETDDQLGINLSMSNDGTIVGIASPYNSSGIDSGHTRVYQYANGTWNQLGGDIEGETVNDNSGTSISMNGNGTIIAIGADSNDGNGRDSGHTRVYQYNNGAWSQLGSDIDGEARDDNSGISVSISDDGTKVAIGANENDGNGGNSGHTRIYQYISGAWIQLGNDIDGETATNYSGIAVSMNNDGTRVAIGAYLNSGNGSYSGHTRVFKYSEGSWNQLGSDIDGEAAYHYAGIAVSMSDNGSKIAIGNNVGSVNVYEFIAPPKINSVSLTSNNTNITVTTDSNVYNTNGASGDLEATDFIFSISGGDAALSSSTPTSIFKTSQTKWILGIGLSGASSGEEILTVSPVANSIFNAAGMEMETSQSNNTSSLNIVIPGFDAVQLAVNNSTVTITASEILYTSSESSGPLETTDFVYSLSGGSATLSSTTPNSISTNGLITTLGIPLSGIPDGSEILKVNPASSSAIYNGTSTALSENIMSQGIQLYPDTIIVNSLTTSGTINTGSLIIDNLVFNEKTIGHSDDTDLITLENGSLIVAGDIYVSSDARLKSNITALEPTLMNLLQIEAKKYTMLADKEQKEKIGLLAQDVQKVFPEIVNTGKDGMLAVNYQALIPVLINALKEQNENYKELESQLSMLEKTCK